MNHKKRHHLFQALFVREKKDSYSVIEAAKDDKLRKKTTVAEKAVTKEKCCSSQLLLMIKT